MKCSEAKRGCSSLGKMRWFTDLTASWDVTTKQDCSTPDTISINIFGSSGVIPSNLKSQVIMRRRIGKGLIHTHFHADVYSIAFNTKIKKKIYKKYNNNNIFIKQPVKIFKILQIFCNRIFQFNFLMTQEHLLIFWWFLFHFVLYLWLPSLLISSTTSAPCSFNQITDGICTPVNIWCDRSFGGSIGLHSQSQPGPAIRQQISLEFSFTTNSHHYTAESHRISSSFQFLASA